jgi:hypothetical protein
MLHQETIIDIFFRFSAASEEQLGYDRSIKRILDSRSDVQYDIQVQTPSGPRVFQTKEMLANYSADRAIGRATRVWEVYEGQGKDGQKTHVLKDTWVEITRPREGETYRNVLAGATDEEKEFFLTVVCDGDVKLASGTDDSTLETRQGSPPGDTFQVFDPFARSYSKSLIIAKPEGMPEPLRPATKPRAFVNRAHYRIVFDEVGVPLSKLRSMGEIWQAACDANKGLYAIVPHGLPY